MLNNLRRALTALVLTLTTATGVAVAVQAQDLPRAARSGEIVAYFPKGMTAADVEKAASEANCTVTRELPYSPGFYLLTVKASRSATRTVKDGLIMPEPEVEAAVSKLMEKPGVKANPNWHIKKYEATKPVPVLAPFARTNRAVQQDDVVTPNDPVYTRQRWHMEMIRMPEAWFIQLGQIGRPVVVAVTDSGLDVAHPDFQGIVFNPRNTTVNPPTADVTDLDGHGTHVAGIIAAQSNNAIGTAGVGGLRANGIDIRILPIKIFPDPDQANAATDSAIAGINYSVQQNADVHNMSWGPFNEFFPPPNPALEQAVANAATTGMVMVAAAGNSRSQADGIWPGSYPGVIRVSSVGPNRRLASYSSFGPRVAIAAPGGDGDFNTPDDVWSSVPPGGFLARQEGGTTVAGYSGTSMASPHVAGVAALMIAGGAARNQVRNGIQSTAQQLDETPQLDPDGSSRYGAGLLDAYNALLPFADPPFVSYLSGNLQRGATYATNVNPFVVAARGVTKAPPVGAVRVLIQTATTPTTTVRELVEGRDFPAFPRTLQPNELRGKLFTVLAPGTENSLNLPPNRYKAVLRVGDSEEDQSTQFFEVLVRNQPLGRTLFSTPFKVRESSEVRVDQRQPEDVLFGGTSLYTLARYNPLRLPSDFDYALFQSGSNGRRDQAASFSATAPDGSPLTYEVTAPGVNIAPVGLGYWLNLTTNSGTPSGIALNAVGPEPNFAVAIRLFASGGGWNLIGAPFSVPTAWGTVTIQQDGDTYTLDEAISANIISPALIGYRNGDYFYNIAPNGNLEPFNGYWVRVYRDCTLIIAPAGTTSRAASAPGTTETPGRAGGWRARLAATVAGDRDGQNYFGLVPGATDGDDRLDVPKPPSGAGHAYLRFVSEGKGGRSISNAFDLRSPDGKNKQEWTAAVSTDRTNADVTLTWDNIGAAPRRAKLTLTDPVTGEKVDMKSRSSYTFRAGEAGSTRLVKITLETRASAGPLAITNVSVQSGRSSNQPGLTVRFNATAEAQVMGIVKSLKGATVGNLTGLTRATTSGNNVLRWDGRSRSGVVVPPGPYMLQITLRADDGQTVTYTQPIQNIQ